MNISSKFVRYLILTSALMLPQTSHAQQATMTSPTSFPFAEDAEYLKNWGLKMINALPAYQLGLTGKGVLVAVVDTGLNIHHPEFIGRISPLSHNFGKSLTPDDVSDVDDKGKIAGHGTHVSGIIGAGRDGKGMQGVAYEANILALRSIDIQADPNEAIRYAINAGANVLNGSYGSQTLSKTIPNPDREGTSIKNPHYEVLTYSPIGKTPEALNNTYKTLKEAAAADIAMVFSAGNQYGDQPIASSIPNSFKILPLITPQNTAKGVYKFINDSQDKFNINNPHTYNIIDPKNPKIANLDYSDLKGTFITVVALGPDGKIADYSNRCGLAAEWCMAAPGGNQTKGGNESQQIYSTFPGHYRYMQGTSMATPHVTGVVAVVRQAFPYMNARQVIQTVLTTATHNGPKEIYGHGKANLGAAVHGPMAFNYEGFFDVDTKGYSSVWSNPISGKYGMTKRGEGNLRLTADNSYTGPTEVLGGTLTLNGKNATSVRIDGTGRLAGTGTVVSVVNEIGGVIAPGDENFGTFTLKEDYTGRGGMVEIATVLGDDNSKTSRLAITRDASGVSKVKVINKSGTGAPTMNGIKIIDIGRHSGAIFNLSGDYVSKSGEQAVVGGAYAYALYKNGLTTPDDGDIYLRSTDVNGNIRYNPGTPLYEGYVQNMQALNKLPSLQQRVGNRYWSNAGSLMMEQGADALGQPLMSATTTGTLNSNRGIWGRIEGGYNHFVPSRSTTDMKQDVNTLIFQSGIDGQFIETETGRLIGGFTAQYGKAVGNIVSRHGDGKISTQGWGLGGTLTWYGDKGFYVDTQAQTMWYDSDLNSTTVSKALTESNRGFGYGLSVEAGQRFDLDAYWSLTPQAQLA